PSQHLREPVLRERNPETTGPGCDLQRNSGSGPPPSARRAVLPNAGGLSQAQASSGDGRKLLHLGLEPSGSLLGSVSHVYAFFYLHTTAKATDFFQSVSLQLEFELSAKR